MNQSEFRKNIRDFLLTVCGNPHTITITFDADFVTGNVIAGDINGIDFLDVNFSTDHATTLQNLAFSIQNLDSVRTATVTAARQITVVGYVSNVALVSTITVTGGATQAVETQATVTAQTSVPVIRMNQKFEQYTEQCVFNVIAVVPFGIDAYRKVDPDTNLSLLVGSRIATLTVSYTGPYAIEKASKIYSELYSETATRFFESKGMAIVRRENIIDTTGLLDTEFQERADFDFFVRYFDTSQEDLGTIETVNIEANTLDEFGNATVEEITIQA